MTTDRISKYSPSAAVPLPLRRQLLAALIATPSLPVLAQFRVEVSGVGLTQEWGQPAQQIKPGDVVWCPPGIKHWHGAGLFTALTLPWLLPLLAPLLR